METKKSNSHLVFYILGFIVAVFFEFYWINNFPYDYFMLIGIGLVVLITGYLAFDGILRAISEAAAERREQNEIMIKAQKAIYLATKKNSAEAENMQVQNLKAVSLLMDRMVDTISENQAKQLELHTDARASAPADLSGLINELTESNAKLAKELQNAVTVNQLVKANEDLVKNVQNMLNGKPVDMAATPGLSQGARPAAASASADSTMPADIPVYPDDTAVSDNSAAFFSASEPDSPTAADALISPADIPEDNDDTADALISTADISEDNDDTADDTINIDDITLEELDDIGAEYAAEADKASSDDEAAVAVMDTDIADAEAYVADASQTVEAMEAAAVLEDAMSGTEESVTEAMDNDTSVPEAAAAMEKGPGDMMTPEEIAALFANM